MLSNKTFEKKKTIYAEDKRQFTKPEDLIKHIIKQGFIKEKVNKATLHKK